LSGLRRSRWLKWLTYAIAAGALIYVVWNLNLADLRQGLAIWTVPSLLLGVIALVVPPVSWAEITGRRRPDDTL